ncbi:MAG: FAD-binding oxidoreductase [Deltaproteobacteria bacterium]|nr:FAD-binding oxidoreductase [Deltaproteobacteria bacterium]
MKITHEQLAQQLQAALGTDAVNAQANFRASHIVDGITPVLVCAPHSAEQIAAILRICSEAETSVVPWGGGTAMALGNPPRQADVVVKTTSLNRVIEHDHANLTATVQSGITLNSLQNALAPQKQFAPFDPPFAERSTVGGVVAANLNGPRRASYGGVRDLIIGMKVVLASGEQIKAGGKVVKNVAGYDMCKLFTGSLGTLGIITEVTLRVAPMPESNATVVVTGSLTQASQLTKELAASNLLPTAVFLANDFTDHSWWLSVGFEGFEATVARQLNDVALVAQRLGMNPEQFRAEKHQRVWQEARDFPLQPNRLIYRVTVPRASVMEIVNVVKSWRNDGQNPMIVVDMVMGTVWIAQKANVESAGEFPKLIALTQQRRGHAVMFAAPSELKSAIDVWGPAPPALSLMREIKQQFDPKGILNPGRFIGAL